MADRLLFYVQHLLGIGHLKRAAVIAVAAAAEGLEVVVASGGLELPEVAFPGARVVQLPPAGIAGEDFSTLIDETGRPVDEAWKARRRDALLDLAAAFRPDTVLIELYPFGRRQFRFELLPLLDRLHQRPDRPVILSSVRDILVKSSRAGRDREAVDLIAERFDAVLVHGDPDFVSFEETFPLAAEIEEKLVYTGYVAPAAPRAPAISGEVVVSVGGGAVGGRLLMTALEARALSAARERPWRLVTGPGLPEEDLAPLLARAEGEDGVVVERFRADFPELLAAADLSISQAGYNTTMDLLRTGVPAVVVPYAAKSETEQTERALRLAARGYMTVVPEAELAPAPLAAAIDAALADAPRRRAMPAADFALDGAARTARILADFARRRAA